MTRARRPPDTRAMADAVSRFLDAAGVDVGAADFQDTAQRVTQAWADEFLSGYRDDARTTLGPLYPAPAPRKRALVLLSHIQFRSMCPHHLMPWEGVAHVAYVPGARIAGLGRLSALVRLYASRLTLQETLCADVAGALKQVLACPGSACIVEARQSCLRLRGERQHTALAHSEAYTGVLQKDGALRRELWARLAHSEGGGR